MPNRQISTQSFDEILSDLGDDPAIPDPHGIRKSPHQKSSQQGVQSPSEKPSFADALKKVPLQYSLQQISGFITIIGVVLGVALGFFYAYSALNNNSQTTQEDSQKLILDLRKDISLLRDEIRQEHEDIYTAIDEIEVSIHSIKNRKSEVKALSKPQAFPHELELRRWRYFGTAQMGNLHQAFLDTGRGLLTFAMGAQLLGDWRLSNIEKDLVTLTHPLGKSIVLRVSKGE